MNGLLKKLVLVIMSIICISFENPNSFPSYNSFSIKFRLNFFVSHLHISIFFIFSMIVIQSVRNLCFFQKWPNVIFWIIFQPLTHFLNTLLFSFPWREETILIHYTLEKYRITFHQKDKRWWKEERRQKQMIFIMEAERMKERKRGKEPKGGP